MKSEYKSGDVIVVPAGVKHDTGKLPYHLIPPELLSSVADILDFGAKKYTTNYETEWDRLLSVPDVESLRVTIQTELVALVTKKSSEELILSSPKNRDRTVGIGKNEILTKLRNTPNVGKLIQELVKETKERLGWQFLESTASQKSGTKNSASSDVPFAAEESFFTLTIATKQGNFEVSSAPNTTTDSVFWETMWKGLEKRFNILKPLNKTGARNWEAGMDWSRVFGALQRHLWAWWKGENKDPETGKSHLWHAATNIAFLVAFEQRGSGKDDRPKI